MINTLGGYQQLSFRVCHAVLAQEMEYCTQILHYMGVIKKGGSSPVRFCCVVDLSIPEDAAHVCLEDVQCGVVAARLQPLLYLCDVYRVLQWSGDSIRCCLAICRRWKYLDLAVPINILLGT